MEINDMHRRRVALVYAIKAMIREGVNQRDASVQTLSSVTGLKTSAVKGALSPEIGINVLTMFDLAEALDMEWVITLRPKAKP
jgi:hypothetical protein